jgi:hypothetical protein
MLKPNPPRHLSTLPGITPRNYRNYLPGITRITFQGGAIHDQILSYRTYPEDLFIGSPLQTTALRFVLSHPPAGK